MGKNVFKVSKNSILQISLKSIAIINRRFKIEDKYFLEKEQKRQGE
ncbi:hypothetical protein VSK92_09860 [Bacillus swezeyi]